MTRPMPPATARLAATLTLLAALAAPSPLAAQESAERLSQAKAFFAAGAKLYEQNRFAEAVQSFEEALKLAPRPALYFSIAQAERKQYLLDRKPDHLRRAVDYYRRYIAEAKNGPRAGEALQALAELEVLLSKEGPMPPASAAATAPPPPPPPMKPRLQIMSTQTRGVRISVDGKAPVDGLFSEEVGAGAHKVKLSAPGYFDEEREVAMQGASIALDIPMKERPALLSFDTAGGAQISVDGRLMGNTPLPVPLDVPAGPHVVTIAKNGHHAYSQEIEVDRGETRTIKAELTSTTQRTVSYVMLGTAAASLVAGGVFTAVAFSKESQATKINDARSTRNLTADELDTYRRAVDARDNVWKPAAGIGFGGAMLLGALGVALYAFDQPAPSGPATPAERKKPLQPGPQEPPGVEMAATPLVGPGSLGVQVGGLF